MIMSGQRYHRSDDAPAQFSDRSAFREHQLAKSGLPTCDCGVAAHTTPASKVFQVHEAWSSKVAGLTFDKSKKEDKAKVGAFVRSTALSGTADAAIHAAVHAGGAAAAV